jgi:hypothetical protein
MNHQAPSDGPTWVGPRGEQPSFPRRGRRSLLALALTAGLSGLALLVAGAGATGWLAAGQVGVGAFAAVLGAFGLLGARRARVCAGCGAAPVVRRAPFPLEAADRVITAIELADPDRLARVGHPTPGQPRLHLELLHCPRCRDLGWLRGTARVEGVLMRVGPTWVVMGSFLQEVLQELEQRRQSRAGSP